MLIADAPPIERYFPVAPIEMSITHTRVKKLTQGGQRIRLTIPTAPGTDARGDSFVYSWESYGGDGSKRCRPGPLPELANVTAGTVIDAPLAKPKRGWCRGLYTINLNVEVTLNCPSPEDCGFIAGWRYRIASVQFSTGAKPTVICHRRGEAEWCWMAGEGGEPASWSVSALLDDLLGVRGATSAADRPFARAFKRHPELRDDYEIDDNEFFGFPSSRKNAIAMAKIVDRVLRAGPHFGRTWPGRTAG